MSKQTNNQLFAIVANVPAIRNNPTHGIRLFAGKKVQLYSEFHDLSNDGRILRIAVALLVEVPGGIIHKIPMDHLKIDSNTLHQLTKVVSKKKLNKIPKKSVIHMKKRFPIIT